MDSIAPAAALALGAGSPDRGVRQDLATSDLRAKKERGAHNGAGGHARGGGRERRERRSSSQRRCAVSWNKIDVTLDLQRQNSRWRLNRSK